MNKEEIKRLVTMSEVVGQHGIKIDRKGFCRCPFHNDKGPSMKIYKDSYHCFGCGANGDVFSFVQQIEGVSFKEAYMSLGGTYEKPANKFQQKRLQEQRKRVQDDLKRQEHERALYRKKVCDEIETCRILKTVLEPFSDDWCWAVNRFELLMAELEEIMEGS